MPARIFAVILAFMVFGCGTGDISYRDLKPGYKLPGKYNFRFIGVDAGIENPENDRRSYYKVYIDKSEEGRTTIGLESQMKKFETRLSPNRHLIIVEKYVLDRKSGKYVKLNNIEQPEPNYFYFTMPENRIVVVKMINSGNSAEFMLDYELK